MVNQIIQNEQQAMKNEVISQSTTSSSKNNKTTSIDVEFWSRCQVPTKEVTTVSKLLFFNQHRNGHRHLQHQIEST
jgi:hypothetical protein